MAKSDGKIGTGGSIERDLVRRWARRRLSASVSSSEEQTLKALIAWLDKQPARTRRPGGIGR